MMRVVVIFPLFLLCVIQNGFSLHLSVMHFSVMHLSVMHLSVMYLSVMQNIEEQYRKILLLFRFLTRKPVIKFTIFLVDRIKAIIISAPIAS